MCRKLEFNTERLKKICKKRYLKEDQIALTFRLSQTKDQTGASSTRIARKSCNYSNPYQSNTVLSTNHQKRHTLLPAVSRFDFIPKEGTVSMFGNGQEHDDTADIIAMLSRIRIEKAERQKEIENTIKPHIGSMPAKLMHAPQISNGATEPSLSKYYIVSSKKRGIAGSNEPRQVLTTKPRIKISGMSIVKTSNPLSHTVQPFNPSVRIRTNVQRKSKLTSMRNPLGLK